MIRPRDIFPYVLLCAGVLSYFLWRITATFAWPESALAAVVVAESMAEVAIDVQILDNDKTSSVDITSADPNSAETVDDRDLNECRVSVHFPQEIRRWCKLITEYAARNELEPDLVAALVWQESGGNPQAYSRSGAVGLMQVMPRDGIAANFICANGPCFENRPTTAKLEDPEFNISYGTRMLSNLIKRYGGLRDALKAYGPMDVGYSYADTVLRIFKRYGD